MWRWMIDWLLSAITRAVVIFNGSLGGMPDAPFLSCLQATSLRSQRKSISRESRRASKCANRD